MKKERKHKMLDLNGVTITGTGSAIPEKVVTNEDLTKLVNTSDEWIRTRTGISERRVVEDHTPVSELCVEAAKKALLDAKISSEEIDLIIVATITPDMPMPGTACIVQEKLGAVNAAAFDLAAACTGFVYALSTGMQFIAAGTYKTVLVIGADTLSKLVDWQDRSTCILFGDGAGTVVLQKAPLGKGILSVHLGSDGSGGNLLYVPAGGSLLPASQDTVAKGSHFIKMNGNEVFKFAVRTIAEATAKALKKCNKTIDDIDYFIPHQANIRIIEAAIKRLKLSPDKVHINLQHYGNSSAASVPVALDEAAREGKIKNGDTILLVAFGGGLTWGASVIQWYKKS
jgi:3-oxoacyl-[acyl-carrier-protein] synthase-3